MNPLHKVLLGLPVRQRRSGLGWLLGTALAASISTGSAAYFDARGSQFMGFDRLSGFSKSPGSSRGETIFVSPELIAQLQWNELIASWNADMPEGSYLKIEVRALYPNRPTKWYVMALWSPDPSQHPRESVPSQKDDDGDVLTDTLVLKAPTDRFQVRLTTGGYWYQLPKVFFLGFSLSDTAYTAQPLAPQRLVWGKTLPVPERSQMAYTNGNVLCSPATVSMLLGYWAQKLNRPELDRQVPEIAQAVHDTKWQGTGNWTFNTAYAGSLKGMRGYVTRLSDLSELEYWIAHGVPVGLSLCYNTLRGRPGEPSGHLVVCVGFTEEGEPVINDPGTRENVRKVFPRSNLVKAWAYSKNAAYLIYPREVEVPRDRFGHWDSWTAKRRVRTATPSIPEIK